MEHGNNSAGYSTVKKATHYVLTFRRHVRATNNTRVAHWLPLLCLLTSTSALQKLNNGETFGNLPAIQE